MIRFCAHFLFILAAWTLAIKFVFPISYAVAEGSPVHTYIYWDFWWVVHLWLGWSLLHWQRYTYLLAVVVSVVEVGIIVTKFVLFLSAPTWTIWQTNWFVNKLFVLACFVLVLGYFVANGARLRRADPRRQPSDGPWTWGSL